MHTTESLINPSTPVFYPKLKGLSLEATKYPQKDDRRYIVNQTESKTNEKENTSEPRSCAMEEFYYIPPGKRPRSISFFDHTTGTAVNNKDNLQKFIISLDYSCRDQINYK